ncbi:MAG: hypothetical protein IIA45_07915 [Bacteroidetes bacterium]|nr:hypothetical protein [Bacteroidota bacterium]
MFVRILLLILLISPILSSSQSVLELRQENTGKVKHIKEGTFVMYKTDSTGSIHRGKVNELRDGIIVIGQRTLRVKQLTMVGELSVVTNSVILLAMPFVVVGVIQATAGLVFLTRGLATSNTAFLIGGLTDFVTGFLVFEVGMSPWFLTSNRRYAKDGWTYKVKPENSD